MIFIQTYYLHILFVITIISLGAWMIWYLRRDSRILPVDKNQPVKLRRTLPEDFIPEGYMESEDLLALVRKDKK